MSSGVDAAASPFDIYPCGSPSCDLLSSNPMLWRMITLNTLTTRVENMYQPHYSRKLINALCGGLLIQGVLLSAAFCKEYTGEVLDASSAILTLGAGDSASDITVRGGKLYLQEDASSSGCRILSAGSEMHVTQRASSKGTDVKLSGSQFVSDHASDEAAVISSGGLQYVSGDATVKDTVISGTGTQFLSERAQGKGIRIDSAGYLYLTDDASIEGVVMSGDNAALDMTNNTRAVKTRVQDGVHTIRGSASSSDLRVQQNGYVALNDQAIAQDVTLEKGGSLSLFDADAQAEDVIIKQGGVMKIFAGKARNITVQAGGVLRLYPRAQVSSLTVEVGGQVLRSPPTQD